MKSLQITHIYLLVCLFGMTIFSCEEDLSPQIDAVMLMNPDSIASQGQPGELVIVDGAELSSLESITFKALSTEDAPEVPVLFNPAVNSDVSIFFYIPFDEALGSDFGDQLVTFTNAEGDEYSIDFTVIQPAPIVEEMLPLQAKPGEVITLKGQWFQNLLKVVVGDDEVETTFISSDEIKFNMPTIYEAASVAVITAVDTAFALAQLDVELGEITLISDFDGGGVHPDGSMWWYWGDVEPLTVSTVDGFLGHYLEFAWYGKNDEGYLGGSTNQDITFDIDETNPSNVLLQLQVDCAGTIGSIASIILQDTDGVHWGYNYTFEVDGWHMLSLPMTLFGYDKDPSNHSKVIDPTRIRRVGFEFDPLFTVNPTIFRVDDIKIIEVK